MTLPETTVASPLAMLAERHGVAEVELAPTEVIEATPDHSAVPAVLHEASPQADVSRPSVVDLNIQASQEAGTAMKESDAAQSDLYEIFHTSQMRLDELNDLIIENNATQLGLMEQNRTIKTSILGTVSETKMTETELETKRLDLVNNAAELAPHREAYESAKETESRLEKLTHERPLTEEEMNDYLEAYEAVYGAGSHSHTKSMLEQETHLLEIQIRELEESIVSKRQSIAELMGQRSVNLQQLEELQSQMVYMLDESERLRNFMDITAQFSKQAKQIARQIASTLNLMPAEVESDTDS